MKRILVITALAVLSLISCRRDLTPGTGPGGDEIGFSPYMERVRTKVNVHDVVSYKPDLPWSLHGFKVAAYLHGTADSYFKSEQTAAVAAAKTPSGAYYTTGSTYFWPTVSKLDFFAYSSAGAGTIVNTSGTASLSFTASTDPADSLYGRDDFVAACALNASNSGDHSYGPGTSVQSLSFGHVMAKVNKLIFKAYDDAVRPYGDASYRFTVVETKLLGIRSTGTYTFNPASGEKNWSDLGGSFDHTFSNILNEAGSSNFFLGNETKSLRVYGYTRAGDGTDKTGHWQWFDDKLIVIPQVATIQVKYKVERKVGDGWMVIMGETTRSARIGLDMGKAYNITLALTNDGDVIVFSAEVDDWDKEVYVPHYIEDDVDYGSGVSCAGTIWAPVNCGVSTDPLGLHYQWGRKYGQRYQGSGMTVYSPLVSSLTIAEGSSSGHADDFSEVYADGSAHNHNWWSDPGVDSTLWNANGADPDAVPVKTSYDPCPDGWRVPTGREMQALMDYARGGFIPMGGDRYNMNWPEIGGIYDYGYPNAGIVFINEDGEKLFFPLPGRIGISDYDMIRSNVDGKISYKCIRRTESSGSGYYWTSTAQCKKTVSGATPTIDCFTGKGMRLAMGGAIMTLFDDGLFEIEPAAGLSVRCVQDNMLN